MFVTAAVHKRALVACIRKPLDMLMQTRTPCLVPTKILKCLCCAAAFIAGGTVVLSRVPIAINNAASQSKGYVCDAQRAF